MNKGVIIILSFLPHERREKYHNRQLDFLLDYFPLDIYIYAIDYKKNQYRKDNKIYYIDIKNDTIPINRNKYLKDFYKTKYSFAFIFDNDTIFYPYYNLKQTIKDICDGYFLNKGIDCFCAWDPTQAPFRKINDNELFKNYYLFKKTVDIKGSFIYLTNLSLIKKQSFFNENELVYFDPYFYIYEDKKFGIDLVNNMYNVYKVPFLILKEMGGLKNSTIFIDLESRKKENERLKDKFPNYSFHYNKKEIKRKVKLNDKGE